MYVCRKCHEQDAYSIDCRYDFSRHDIMMLGNCEICGSYGSIILCAMYDVSAQKGRKLIEEEGDERFKEAREIK